MVTRYMRHCKSTKMACNAVVIQNLTVEAFIRAKRSLRRTMHSALGTLLLPNSNVFFDTLQGIPCGSRIVVHSKHVAIHILQISCAGTWAMAEGARCCTWAVAFVFVTNLQLVPLHAHILQFLHDERCLVHTSAQNRCMHSINRQQSTDPAAS